MSPQAVSIEVEGQREGGDYSTILPFPELALFWTSCLEKGKQGGERSGSLVMSEMVWKKWVGWATVFAFHLHGLSWVCLGWGEGVGLRTGVRV